MGGRRAYEKKGPTFPLLPHSSHSPSSPRSRATKVHSHAALPDKTAKRKQIPKSPIAKICVFRSLSVKLPINVSRNWLSLSFMWFPILKYLIHLDFNQEIFYMFILWLKFIIFWNLRQKIKSNVFFITYFCLFYFNEFSNSFLIF